MKKILWTVYIFLASVFTGIAQEGQYQIEGQLPASINEELILVAETEQGVAELSRVAVVNGSFKLMGSVPGVTVVHLMPAQKNAVFTTLMLENAPYTISLGTDGWVVDGGGEAQKVWGEFYALKKFLLQNQRQLEARAKTATNAMQVQALQKEFQKVVSEAEARDAQLFEKHTGSMVVAYVLASGMQGMDEVALSARYDVMGEDAKGSMYGKRIASRLAQLQTVAVGAVAPDFKAPLSEGGVLTLHETKGKVKVIDFWASWCQPCRKENVNLLSIYKHYRPKGLEIISVSLDNDKQAWLKAIGQDGCYWKCVSDLKGKASEIAAAYNVTAIPYTLILDEENRIIAKNLRGKALENKIAEMLKKKK